MLPQKPCKLLGATPQCDGETLTKRRVLKNTSTSILLKAPVEVRDKILRLVLGDGMIHIQYLREVDWNRIVRVESVDAGEKPLEVGLYSAFCVAEKSEQEAYDEANRSSKHVQPNEDVEACKDRHKDCLIRRPPYDQVSYEKLQQGRLSFDKHLSVLAVCRLLYEESNNVLWQTNTFAFDDPQSFKSFITSMNASQKHKLKMIHIRMNVPIDRQLFDFEGYGPWAKAITPRILPSLHNLSVLHLSFDQYCGLSDLSQALHRDPFLHTDSEKRMKHDMDATLGLRLLPWKNLKNSNHGKHVTVIFSDDVSTHLPIIGSRWTKDQKLELAEEFRARLAAPNSGEIHVAEVAANQEAKRLKNEKSRRAMIRCLEATISNQKIKVNAAKKAAEDLRAEADRRVAKQDDAILKGLKSVETRTISATYFNNRAEKAEERHEKDLEKLAGCEEELAKSLAETSYTPKKHVPWSYMHEYMSD